MTSYQENIINCEVNIGSSLTNIKEFDYEELYSHYSFIKALKISSLSSKIKLYFEKDIPLQLETNVGSLGVIYFFMKSKIMSVL